MATMTTTVTDYAGHLYHFIIMIHFDVVQVSVAVQSAHQAVWEVWAEVQLSTVRRHREIKWCASELQRYVTSPTSLCTPILCVGQRHWQQLHHIDMCYLPLL